MMRYYMAILVCLVAATVIAQEFELMEDANRVTRRALIGEWLFTDGAKDFSGNGYHGTLSNHVSIANEYATFVQTGGVYCSASLPQPLTAMTASVWIRTTNAEISYFFSRYTPTGNKRSWALLIYPATNWGALIAGTGDGAQRKWKSESYPIADSQWHQVAFTFTSNSLTIYRDGEMRDPVLQDDDAVGTLFDATGYPIYFGGWDGLDYAYSGDTARGRIWNRALTVSEISNLYLEGSP